MTATNDDSIPVAVAAQVPDREISTRPRPMTVVWGALLVLAGGALVAWALGARFDVLIVGSVVLGVAGVALVVSAIVSSSRSQV